MTKNQITNEFSRLFNLELINKSGTEIELEATLEECEKLAARFFIPKVNYLAAKCVFKKMSQKQIGDYSLSVNMGASIIQQCVVTLNDINESIEEKFSIIFHIDPDVENSDEQEKEIDFEAHEEDIEYINDKEIDVGGYIAEYLSLSMKQYPRQDKVIGSELGHKITSEDENQTGSDKKNPFSVLKDLKHKT